MDESSSKKIDCTKIQDERQKTPVKTLTRQGGGTLSSDPPSAVELLRRTGTSAKVDVSPKDKAGYRIKGVWIKS
jgi:hypothetical protein